MKILTVVGARPQFIKAAAVSRKLRLHNEEILVHTGQHYDSNMSEVFFEEMHIPQPDYNLKISGGGHGEMTGRMLIELEKLLLEVKPDAVLLYGDTNSTLAGALTAVKLHIPIAHVEAGNRLGTLDNPEEVNRITADHASKLLLCATETAKENLIHENLGDRAHVVGNIMYDSFLYFSERMKEGSLFLTDYEGRMYQVPGEFYYLTCHREENTFSDAPLNQIFMAMEELDAPVIYPVHPRNRERALRLVETYHYRNLKLVPPVKYSESVWLTNHAKKIITDSGGLQCEAFFAKKQCVTVFHYKVWPETLVDNRNQLSFPKKEEILEKLSREQKINESYQPFGDGHAAEKIVSLIEEKLI